MVSRQWFFDSTIELAAFFFNLHSNRGAEGGSNRFYK